MSTCVKPFRIVIESSFTCPTNFVGSLSAASPRSTVREITKSNTPYYCHRESMDMAIGDYVKVDVGEVGIGGALDAYLYILINGQASAGSNTTLTDITKNWPVNALAGKVIVFVSGTGNGGSATIASNTATQVTFTAPYGSAIDNTTHYSIIVDDDDDSGPGSNAEVAFTATFADTYTLEGTTYARNITGGFEMDFVCLEAAFDGTPYCPTSLPKLGDTINFTDLTVGNPTSWDWDFGDGSAHSTEQNPAHQFLSTDYTPRDPGAIGNYCGNVHIVLTARKGNASSTADWYMSLNPPVRIKNYNASFFTRSVFGGQAQNLNTCVDTVLPDWDGVLNPNCQYLPCKWVASGVNLFGKLVDIVLARNAPNNWGVGMPGGLYQEGFALMLGCYGNGTLCIYSRATTSNQPPGVYNLYWAPDYAWPPGPLLWGNDIQAPLTLEIEYVP